MNKGLHEYKPKNGPRNNEGAENVNANSASAQADDFFVPSKEWQDVPDWADPLPPCGEYRTNFNTKRRQARWDNPPGPEAVSGKRTGKVQTVGAAQKEGTEREQRREDSTQMSAEELAKTVIGDPWEWYSSELERVLGKDWAFQFRWEANGENSFEAYLPFLPSEADLMVGVGDESDFPIKHAPQFIQKFSKELASYAGVPVSIPFLATVAMLSTALGRNLRIARGQLQLLGRGRVQEIEERCKHLLEIVVKQPKKRMSFGKLKDNHGFEPAELRQLAGVSDGKLRIVEPAKGGKGGRPTCYVEAV
jgi:hypothetical protein